MPIEGAVDTERRRYPASKRTSSRILEVICP